MEGEKKSEYVRPTWDEYFLEVRTAVAKRATCDRGRTACVIAKDKQVVSTGYVGSPAGLPHCDEVGHLFKDTIHEDGHRSTHCVRTVHAEINAITNAAKRGVSIDGGTAYCGMTPCRTCAMAMINSGIKRVVCVRKYHEASESEEMFAKVGISLDYMEKAVEEYPNQKAGT
jgi:dCMP deaminase